MSLKHSTSKKKSRRVWAS